MIKYSYMYVRLCAFCSSVQWFMIFEWVDMNVTKTELSSLLLMWLIKIIIIFVSHVSEFILSADRRILPSRKKNCFLVHTNICCCCCRSRWFSFIRSHYSIKKVYTAAADSWNGWKLFIFSFWLIQRAFLFISSVRVWYKIWDTGAIQYIFVCVYTLN